MKRAITVSIVRSYTVKSRSRPRESCTQSVRLWSVTDSWLPPRALPERTIVQLLQCDEFSSPPSLLDRPFTTAKFADGMEPPAWILHSRESSRDREEKERPFDRKQPACLFSFFCSFIDIFRTCQEMYHFFHIIVFLVLIIKVVDVILNFNNFFNSFHRAESLRSTCFWYWWNFSRLYREWIWKVMI